MCVFTVRTGNLLVTLGLISCSRSNKIKLISNVVLSFLLKGNSSIQQIIQSHFIPSLDKKISQFVPKSFRTKVRNDMGTK